MSIEQIKGIEWMSMRDARQFLRIINLNRLAYAPALVEQRRIHRAVLDGDEPPTVLFVEHDPVITITPRPGAAGHLRADENVLAKQGVALCETDRGGDITYHGPGQIVAYPIIRLNDLKINVRQYVRLLEEAIIQTLADFGITGRCEPGLPGVWVDDAAGASDAVGSARRPIGGERETAQTIGPPAKIAAIGVRVRRWVTMHGLALNVHPNLEHFDLIVPCGLHGRTTTSMARLLGERCPPIARVREQLAGRLQDCLSCR